MIKKVFPLSILIAVVLFAALPLLLPGFIPTHDGEYHLIRFYEFEGMLQVGHWFPRWAPGLNSGYGMPLFNFFYPFPNYIGALYHNLGWSLIDSLKLTLFTGYAAAVVFCYFWLSKIFGKSAAIVGSVIFAFVPYWFVDLYVRGSVGEVVAIMWFMIFLAGVERRWATLIGISVAGIILSHNILSMLFVALSIVYAFFRNRQYVTQVLLGIGLSAYFWIPALLERRYVIGLNTVNFHEHFSELFQLLIPSWGTGFSVAGIPNGEMSQQLGVMTIVMSVWAAVFVFRTKERWERRLIGGSLLLLLFVAFLMLGISQPIWELLTPLQLLQYPWRFLSVVLPTVGLLSAYVASKLKGAVWSIGVALVAVIFALGYVRPVIYEPRDDAYYLSRREFTDGTSSLGNSFSTLWSPWKRERAKERVEIVGEIGEISGLDDKDPMNMRFATDAEKETLARVNTAYYPGWAVTVDGKNATIDFAGDGTITFIAPPGLHTVRVYFAETLFRNGANAISLISLLWISLSAILRMNYAYRYRHHTA